MQYKRASALGWTKDAIYGLATKLSERLSYTPHAEMEAFVDRLGGSLCFQDFFEFNSSNDGSIKVKSLNDFVIYVPSYVSDARNRFTIAHELGHYFLHFQIKNKCRGSLIASRLGESDDDRAELEANWFAAGFLMPEHEFVQKVSDFNRDTVALARHFNVSVTASMIQMKYYDKKFATSI